jgi:hypothetical protein
MIIPGEKAALGGLEGSTKWNREMGKLQARNQAASSVITTKDLEKKKSEEEEEGQGSDVGKWNQ